MRRRRLTPALLATLGFLAGVGPFATDMYLASFTEIAHDLGGTPATVQLTLTTFLFGIAAGQLVLGPISDRFGRRRVLVTALAVFAASSIALVFSPSLPVFIALRAVQGFSGAAGVVVSRAVAVDLSEGDTAVRALSLMAMVAGLGPLIAPPIGGAIAQAANWHVVLAMLAAIAVIMLLLAVLVVPESLPPQQRHTGGFATLAGRFRTLLTDRAFAGGTLAFATGFAAMMAYISASPFVGQVVLRMSPFAYALAFATGAVSLVLANSLNARIAPRVGPGRMLIVGVAMIATSALVLTVLSTTGSLGVASFIACAFVLTGGAGFTMSNASALALARAEQARGSGAALLGATQFFIGGLSTPVVGLWGEHTAVPMAIVALGFGLLALAAAVWTVRAR
jgi:DHA1 family bicyclomycin/chloramphenicol resistance-like MFS transporter